jgi:hypothetical protein
MYLAFAQIPDPVVVPALADLAKALRGDLRDAEVRLKGSGIEIEFHGSTFEVSLADGPHVAAESQDLARQPKIAAKSSLASEVGPCKRRLEIAGPDDPGMEHFNDFLLLLQSVERAVPGALLLDPREGEVI